MSYKIWQLIHRLSPTEKTNFKKQHLDAESAKYLEMFDLLNKMKTYDKKKFDAHFGKDNKTSRLKNYLYSILLSDLVNHSVQNDSFVTAKHHLSSAQILFYKSLFPEAKNQLQKSLDESIKTLDYYTALECNRYLRKIAQFEANKKEVDFRLKEENNVIQIIEEINQFEYLHFLISSTSFKRGNELSQGEKKIYEQVINNPLLRKLEKCRSIISKSYFLRIWTMYSEMIGNMNDFYKYAKKRYDLLLNTSYAETDTWNFVNTHNNLIESCLFTERLDEAEYYIESLRNIQTDSVFDQGRKEVRSAILELHLKLAQNTKPDWSRVDELAKSNIAASKNFTREDEVLESITLTTMLYFNHQKFKDVRRWFNEFQKLPKSSSRLDLQCYLLIMNLYSFYMTGDHEYIRYLMNRYKRFFQSTMVLNDFERHLISDLEKNIRIKSPRKEIARDLRELKMKEISINDSVNNYNVGRYLNFKS